MEPIKIKAFLGSEEFNIPEELASTLAEVFNRQMEAYEIAKKNNVLKSEIVSFKIHKFIPEVEVIPIKLILACKNDSLFKSVIKFCDSCHRVWEDTSKWRASDVDFAHPLFRELISIQMELAKKITQIYDPYPGEIDQLVKKMLDKTYLPSTVTLAISEAQQILPRDGIEESLKNALTNPKKAQLFRKIVDSCQKIIRIKKSGIEHSKQLTCLVHKLKNSYKPVTLVLFQDDRDVFLYIRDLIDTAETETFNWIW